MICYSIKDCDSIYCKFLLETRLNCAVEIRLDGDQLSTEEIGEIFSYPRKATAIASFARNGEDSSEEAVERLSAAIMAGADFVDIGLWLPQISRSWLITLALNKGCRIILSHHDFSCTPDVEYMKSLVKNAFMEGADIVKIATTSHSGDDTARITKLYDSFKPESLIAFAMGEKGKESRLESYYRGAPFFYIAIRRGYETGAGQYCKFDFVNRREIRAYGEADVPSSKSVTQRAIILASLTEGKTRLYGYSPCRDTVSAIKVAEQFGAEVLVEGSTITIDGHQNIRKNGLVINGDTINVGESALLARLCIPICALSGKKVTITGEGTLMKRKICRGRTVLGKFGVKVKCTDRDYLPVTVTGKLHSGEGVVNGKHGSQLISGLLIALSQCEQDSFLLVRNATSKPYFHLTTKIGSYFNLNEPSYPEEEEDADRTFIIDGNQTIRPVGGMMLEKDWSAAAYFLAAGAIAGDVTIPGMNMQSEQGDCSIYDFMDQCNVDVTADDSGDVNARRSIICPFSFDLSDTPDLIGPVILLALRADGESCIDGLYRLHDKESDRAATFVEEFRKIGADMFIAPDGCLYIEGNGDAVLKGGRCSSHGDHRLAMALSLASLICREPVEIDDTECISKSFPGFLETLEKMKVK